MSPSRSTSRRPVALVGMAAVISAVLPTSAALADEPGTSLEVVTVQGTLVNLAVEVTDPDAAARVGDLVVDTMVEVDGTLYPLPDEVPVEGGVTGQTVEVALAAEAGLEPEEALAIATADEPAPGSPEATAAAVAAAVETASAPVEEPPAEETPAAPETPAEETSAAEETPAAEAPAPAPVPQVAAPATDGPAAQAEVLAVTTTGDPAAAAEVLAEAAIGSHTLTVLPVYWKTPDGTSRADLADLAAQTAQYWSEQSGGRISMTTSARDWKVIANPGTCDTTAILRSALDAHGVAAPTSTDHVVVYFPAMAACGGWAGMASIGGGWTLVNGTPIVDVFTHELGHNLGLGHANLVTCTSGSSRVPLGALSSCRVREYADTADVMGYAIAGKRSGNLNTALADHLGLVTVVRPTLSSPVTVDLAPLSATNATRAVAIPVAGGTVYVDFRPASGRDTRQPAWAGVQVHLRLMDPVAHYPTSYLLDMSAPVGGEFATAAFPAGAPWSVPGSGLVVTVESVGATSARVSVTAGPSGLMPAIGLIDNYVGRVYSDLFGRSVDAGGAQTWRNALTTGTPRVAVANAITSSAEYRSKLITGSYATYLGRTPDPSGLKFWLAQMSAGMTIQTMEAGFLASTEYYSKAGGSNAAWVTELYRHVLGRDPGASEVAHWTGVLAQGFGRGDVALGFLLSTEHLTTVVDGYYVDLLGRHIDPAGRTTWVRAIQSGARTEAIIGGIVASDEYYRKASAA